MKKSRRTFSAEYKIKPSIETIKKIKTINLLISNFLTDAYNLLTISNVYVIAISATTLHLHYKGNSGKWYILTINVP